jgi:uncharacterized protein (TIGR02118 family)
MHKLMLLFHIPENVLEFEQNWSENFVSVAERMPGILRVAVTRIYGGPKGSHNLHMIHEFYFQDSESLHEAMVSKEGQAAGQALLSFASEEVTIVYAEHLEEARPLK